MDPLFYPRRWGLQRSEAVATFWKRMLDEGLERYLASFDDEPADAQDTADDYAGSASGMFLCGTGLDDVQDTANDADDERTAQLLHDELEADPDATLTVDTDWRKGLVLRLHNPNEAGE